LWDWITESNTRYEEKDKGKEILKERYRNRETDK
jgi:hypothetical protein